MKQTSIVEEVEVPDQWEVEQEFIEDQLEEEQEDKRFNGKDDPTQYFKCRRCHRKVDRAKEVMMSFSGGNQTYGLQRRLHTYCFNCWIIVSKENKNHLGGLTGREFASVASELMNQRIKQ